jgi:DNA topoisomerase-2
MGKKSEPQVTISLKGANWTKVTFKPDIAKFNMTHLDDDVIALMRRRVVDIAGILAPTTLQVSFNGKRLPRFLGFPTYVNMYLDAALLSNTWDSTEIIPRFYDSFRQTINLSVLSSNFELCFYQFTLAFLIGSLRSSMIRWRWL